VAQIGCGARYSVFPRGSREDFEVWCWKRARGGPFVHVGRQRILRWQECKWMLGLGTYSYPLGASSIPMGERFARRDDSQIVDALFCVCVCVCAFYLSWWHSKCGHENNCGLCASSTSASFGLKLCRKYSVTFHTHSGGPVFTRNQVGWGGLKCCIICRKRSHGVSCGLPTLGTHTHTPHTHTHTHTFSCPHFECHQER